MQSPPGRTTAHRLLGSANVGISSRLPAMLRAEKAKHISTPGISTCKAIVVTATVLCVACWFYWGARLHKKDAPFPGPRPSPIDQPPVDIADDGARRLKQVERMYGLHAEQPWLSYIESLGTEVVPPSPPPPTPQLPLPLPPPPLTPHSPSYTHPVANLVDI